MDRLLSTFLIVFVLIGCSGNESIEPAELKPFVSNMLTASDTLQGISTLDLKFLYLEEGESIQVELGDHLVYLSTFNGLPGDTVYRRVTFDSFEYTNGLYPLTYTLSLASGEEVKATSEVNIVNTGLTLEVDDFLIPNQFGDFPDGLIHISNANGWELDDGSYLNGWTQYFKDYSNRWNQDHDYYFVHVGYSRHSFHSSWYTFLVNTEEVTHWKLSRRKYSYVKRSNDLRFEVDTAIPFQNITLSDDHGAIINHGNEFTTTIIPFQEGLNDLLVSYFSDNYNTFAFNMYQNVSDELIVDLQNYQSSEVLKIPSTGSANSTIKGYNSIEDWYSNQYDFVNMYGFSDFFIPLDIEENGGFEHYYSRLTTQEGQVQHEQYHWGSLPNSFIRRDISYDLSRQDDVLQFDFSSSQAEVVELVLSNDRARRWSIFLPKTLKEFVIPSRLDFPEMEVKRIIFHESPSMDYDRFRELYSKSLYELSPDNFSKYLKTSYSTE